MVPILQLTYLWQVPTFLIDFLGRFMIVAAVTTSQSSCEHLKFTTISIPRDGNSNKLLTSKALCSLQLKILLSSMAKFLIFQQLCIFDKTIPESSISSKPRKPWFDSECKQVIKERKKAEKSFRRSPSQDEQPPLSQHL